MASAPSTPSQCGPCPPQALPSSQCAPLAQAVTPAPSITLQVQPPVIPAPPQSPVMQMQGLSVQTPPPPPPDQSPKVAEMQGISMMQCQTPTILQAPPQPEVYLSCVAN